MFHKMHQQAILIILLIISFRSYAQIQSLHGIIPQPVSVLISEGRFQLTNETAVKWNNPADSATGNMLAAWITKKLHRSNVSSIASYETLQAINLVRSSTADIPEEGYKLIVNENEVTIKSADGAGIFYGTQTLLQLIVEDTATARYTIPVATISDYPRYKWRGMHLDVARHFFSKEEVKQYIDYLAAY
ncbi:MAG: beta-N-acetylhexosaminidase, partial [Chitinophagales bacterium]|nr:beta-N-acetylhexosaminidase [Chitinophagales bacterium]